MNILFVTLFPLENNTSVTKSNYGILKGLMDLGHHITIMMPKMSTKNGSYDDAYDLSMCRIVRIGDQPFGELVPHVNPKTLWYKVKHKLHKEFDILDITKVYLEEADKISIPDDKYDVVISTSDPKTSHLFVKRLIARGLKYDRWIQHWGDPLNGDITRKNCYPDKIIQWYERRIIKSADKVVYVSPFTAETQKRVYPDLVSRIVFVPLPCEDIKLSNEVATNTKREFVLSYLGDYNLSIRDIRPLYNACKSMPNVKLIVAGHPGPELEQTNNITIYPRLPLTRVREIEDASDVLVSVGNIRGTQIPGKIYYMASTQKHILVIVDGDNKEEMKRYINSYNRYIYCDNTVDSIMMALSNLRSKKAEYSTPSVLLPVNIASAIISDDYEK